MYIWDLRVINKILVVESGKYIMIFFWELKRKVFVGIDSCFKDGVIDLVLRLFCKLIYCFFIFCKIY